MSNNHWALWHDQFRRDFEVVAAHYGFSDHERAIAKAAAMADKICAGECYKAIANSLRPEGKSKYGTTARNSRQ